MTRGEIPAATQSGSPYAVWEGLEALLGDEGVEHAQKRGEVVAGQLGQGGAMVVKVVLGGMQEAAGDVVDEQVVDGDVEGLGDARDGVQGPGDLAGLVAPDVLGVGVNLVAELGLGPTCFLAHLPNAAAKGRGRGYYTPMGPSQSQ